MGTVLYFTAHIYLDDTWRYWFFNRVCKSVNEGWGAYPIDAVGPDIPPPKNCMIGWGPLPPTIVSEDRAPPSVKLHQGILLAGHP